MSSDESEYNPGPVRSKRRRSSPSSPQGSESRPTRERNGCLSCRLRRKKCTDEVVNGESPRAPCDGCERLRIECLGWGKRRPPFLKNKSTVEAIKTAVKDFLNGPDKNNASRGRLSLAPYYGEWNAPFPIHDDEAGNESLGSAAASPASDDNNDQTDPPPFSENSQSLFSPQQTYRHEPSINFEPSQLAGPNVDCATEHLHLTLRPALQLQISSDPVLTSIFEDSPTSEATNAVWNPSQSPESDMLHAVPPTPFDPPSSIESSQDTCASYADTALMSQPLFEPSLPTMSYGPYQPTLAGPADFSGHLVEALLPQPNGHHQGILNMSYYPLPFRLDGIEYRTLAHWHSSVRKFMYRYVPEQEMSLVDIYGVVLKTDESFREVVNVARNLIRLHEIASQPQASLNAAAEVEDIAQQQALVSQKLQLCSNAHPDDTGVALGALFGLSFSLFRGGVYDWTTYLEIACKWLNQTWPAICNNSAPSVTRIFAGMIAWFDILGAVSLRRKPMTSMSLLEQMLADNSSVQLKDIMGCENKIMLGIAYTAYLSAWKEHQLMATGVYDVQTAGDFATRIIEQYLHQPATFGPEPPFLWPSDPFNPPAAPRWADNTVPPPTVTSLFRAAARVYLETVIALPGNFDDLALHTDLAMNVLGAIPPSDADRSLVWPLTVIGSMARAEHRGYIADRFARLDGRHQLGNCGHAEALVRDVWQRRDAYDHAAAAAPTPFMVPVVDWMHCMANPVLLA